MKTLLISLLLFISVVGCEHNLSSNSDINTKLNGRWLIVDENKINYKTLIVSIKDGYWNLEDFWSDKYRPFNINQLDSNYFVTLINNHSEIVIDSLGNSKEVYNDTKLLLKINHNDTLYLSPIEPTDDNSIGIMKLIRKK